MWKASALEYEVRAYDCCVIRIVEALHRISTDRLAANAEDQALLEALADEVKPTFPVDARSLPWLLASPFRYGLGRPSRFRAPDVRLGIFYASEEIETAVTEAAYWRLATYSRSPPFERPRTPTPMPNFSVRAPTEAALNLTQLPFVSDCAILTHPTDYSATQELAASAREAAWGFCGRLRRAERRVTMSRSLRRWL